MTKQQRIPPDMAEALTTETLKEIILSRLDATHVEVTDMSGMSCPSLARAPRPPTSTYELTST